MSKKLSAPKASTLNGNGGTRRGPSPERLARKAYHERLGSFLKEARLKSGCVQKVVAEKAGLKTTQFISNIERGLCAVSPAILRVMIREYGIKQGEFLNFIATIETDYNKQVLFNGASNSRSRKR